MTGHISGADAATVSRIDRDFAVPGTLDTILLGQPSEYVLGYILKTFSINASTIYDMWNLSHVHRKYILASDLVGDEIKRNLILEKYEQESILARNTLYFSEIEWKHPSVHELLISDPGDINALFRIMYEDPDQATRSLALFVLMLETSTNRDLPTPSDRDGAAWLGLDDYDSVPLRTALRSETLIAGMPHHVSSWLNFLDKHTGREFVAEQIGDAWYSGFLSSDLTPEEMFVVGSKLNRYVDAVSQSPFTPLWILRELSECSDRPLSSSARTSLSVRNSTVFTELVARKRKVVQDYHHDQADRAADRRSEDEDLHLFEEHKERTGY